MTRICSVQAAVLVMLLLSGCQLSWLTGRRTNHPPQDPALPMTLSRNELIDYLNSHVTGLSAWTSPEMRLHLTMPNGTTWRLKGSICCQSPSNFRLTAEHITGGKADIGSNCERCWVYMKPGEPTVMTWRHEDTPLLQHLPEGIPYIDPNWLMIVLGVKPLKHDDYILSQGPMSERELWLTAIEQGASGRPMRRVIKVNTMRGVIREHAVYDSENRLLVRAGLDDYKSSGGFLLPQTVSLEFPQMDTTIAIRMDRIRTNESMQESLWEIPGNGRLAQTDIGRLIRQRLGLQQPTAAGGVVAQGLSPDRLSDPPWSDEPPDRTAFAQPGGRRNSISAPELLPEPDWSDDPVQPNW